jgi:organic hydroperoxide reductase OsmC/OhrA
MAEIRARVECEPTAPRSEQLRVTVATEQHEHRLHIQQKPDGRGLETNGGELLCLALATCFCNDVYREAALRSIVVDRVEVQVNATFGEPGEAAKALSYHARVAAQAPEGEIRALVEHTDRVSEVQNTLRRGFSVSLTGVEVESRAGAKLAAGD